MTTKEKLNLTMLCDFYELTMANGYWKHGFDDRITYFDVFFRNVPDNGGFAAVVRLKRGSRRVDAIISALPANRLSTVPPLLHRAHSLCLVAHLMKSYMPALALRYAYQQAAESCFFRQIFL